jgi:hypothetical protein
LESTPNASFTSLNVCPASLYSITRRLNSSSYAYVIKIINAMDFIIEIWEKEMRIDTILRVDAINLLIENFGEVNAERFMAKEFEKRKNGN